MADRAVRLVKLGALPGFLATGWAMIGHGSNIQFVASVADWVSKFSDSHPMWIFCAGLAWLAGFVAWPEIKASRWASRLLSWVPPSDGERLQMIEEQLPAMHGSHDEVMDRLDTFSQLLNKNAVVGWDRFMTKAALKIATLQEGADQQRPWIEEIEKRLNALVERFNTPAAFFGTIWITVLTEGA